MTLTKEVAFSRIQRQVLTAEEQSDLALMSKIDLMRELVNARSNVELDSRAIGQDAIIRLNKSIGSEIAAMNDLLRTHSALSDAAEIVGGVDHDDKPEWPTVAPASEAA